jgi:hypothetical protein
MCKYIHTYKFKYMQRVKDTPSKVPIMVTASPNVFTQLSEAMIASWRVLEEILQKHLQPVMSLHNFTKSGNDPIDIGAELVGIKTKVEQGLFKTPYDVHMEVVCLWRNCYEKAANTPLYAVCTCLYIYVRMYTRLCMNLCVCEELLREGCRSSLLCGVYACMYL